MKKLNKTQQWQLIETMVNDTISASEAFKKGTETKFTDELMNALASVLKPKTATSTKIDSEGNVYCNYFEDYFAPENFKTKQSKPDSEGNRKEVYKSNCIEAEKIIRKARSAKNAAINETLRQFKEKLITNEEMTVLLEQIDTMYDTKFELVEDVKAFF